MEIKTGAAYVRVSTDGQLDLSLDAQKREILKYAKVNGIIIPEEFIFTEKVGISGKKANCRPEFQRMIATARQKPAPFEAVLVWKFSRFARNQDESTFYKSMLRKKCGVDVISVTEPIMEGMYGRLIETIIEWSDEFYSYNLAQEVRRGMTEKAMRGGYQCKPPIGYTPTPDGVPGIVPDRAAIVQRIFQEFDQGYDRTGIARRLNADGFRTDRGNTFENRMVTYILQNPFYIGKIRWNHAAHGSRIANPEEEIILVNGQHEPIIDADLFNRVQKRLAAVPHVTRSRAPSTCSHWLSGVVRCSSCGSTLALSGPTDGRYFQCHAYAKGKCSVSHAIMVKKLETALLEELQSTLKTEKLDFQMPLPKIQNYNIRTSLKRIEQKENKAREAYMAGIDTLDEYREIRNALRAEREALDVKPETISREEARRILLGRIRELTQMLKSGDFTNEQKGIAVRSVFDKIIFDRPQDTLHYFYLYS